MIILIFSFIIGLILGSFINVVIHRGPTLWHLLPDEEDRGTLWGPRSKCPTCKAPIKAKHNIPIISYVLLGGKCASCSAKIPFRYPLVELAAGLIVVIAIMLTQPLSAGAFVSAYFLTLLTLGVIDFETGYLPDALTLPLIMLGVVANGLYEFVSIAASLFGAVFGYVSFWMVNLVYRALKGHDGLGMGDAKLLAAIGAWGGWMVLAPTILMASLSALVVVGFAAIQQRSISATTMIRFGPFLSFAALIIFSFLLYNRYGLKPLTSFLY